MLIVYRFVRSIPLAQPSALVPTRHMAPNWTIGPEFCPYACASGRSKIYEQLPGHPAIGNSDAAKNDSPAKRALARASRGPCRDHALALVTHAWP